MNVQHRNAVIPRLGNRCGLKLGIGACALHDNVCASLCGCIALTCCREHVWDRHVTWTQARGDTAAGLAADNLMHAATAAHYCCNAAAALVPHTETEQ